MIAVVLGSAATLTDDLPALPTEGVETVRTLVVAVNRTGITFPHVDHWVSLHPECFWRNEGDPQKGWVQKRLRSQFHFERAADRPALWGPVHKSAKVDHTLETTGKGSSGYFGIEVAKHLGAEKIILCGIPMTPTPHFDNDEPWEMAHAHWKHWLREHEKGKLSGVRSMSGRTRDLLGAPTTEWLRGPAVTTG